MAEDRIVFNCCARVGLKSTDLVTTNCPPGGSGQGSRDVLIFWQISFNISKMVQDKNILTMEDYMKSYIAYQLAATAVTLNDLEHFVAFYAISTDSVH